MNRCARGWSHQKYELLSNGRLSISSLSIAAGVEQFLWQSQFEAIDGRSTQDARPDMYISRTDSRERGASYNQHHGSKQHRDHPGRDEPTPSADDAIELSLTALAGAAEGTQVVPTPPPIVDQPPPTELHDGVVLPHIDITV